MQSNDNRAVEPLRSVLWGGDALALPLHGPETRPVGQTQVQDHATAKAAQRLMARKMKEFAPRLFAHWRVARCPVD
jgi:hypothetical protein